MNAKIRVTVKNRAQARAIQAALERADVRAFAITIGLLDGLPTDRARVRVLQYVTDHCDETAKAAALKATPWLRQQCPICRHEWTCHDPEDGMCDHASDGHLGVCACGRNPDWMGRRIATLSRRALLDAAPKD